MGQAQQAQEDNATFLRGSRHRKAFRADGYTAFGRLRHMRTTLPHADGSAAANGSATAGLCYD